VFSTRHQVYADDILLFIKLDYLMIDKIKCALKGFKGISGLKINCAKSELISLNLTWLEAD
jgi:hypothetical protein